MDWNEFTDLLRNLASQFLSQSSLKIKLDKCKQTVSKEMLGINSGHFRVRLPALEILSIDVICLAENAEWQAPITPQLVMSHHSLASAVVGTFTWK